MPFLQRSVWNNISGNLLERNSYGFVFVRSKKRQDVPFYSIQEKYKRFLLYTICRQDKRNDLKYKQTCLIGSIGEIAAFVSNEIKNIFT